MLVSRLPKMDEINKNLITDDVPEPTNYLNGTTVEKVRVDEENLTNSEPSSEVKSLLSMICSENEENKNYAIKTFLSVLVTDIPNTMITSCSLIYATNNPECVKIVIANGFEHILKKLISTNTLNLDLILTENVVKHGFVLETYSNVILKLPEDILKTFLLKFLIQELFKVSLNESIRNFLIDISFKIIKQHPIISFEENDIKCFITDVFKRYTKSIELMRQQNNPHWHRLWMFLVRFLAKNLHTATELANGLLRVVEYAFRNTSCDQRLKGYECWKELIDNASLDKQHMCSPKQFKLLVTPLKAKFSRIDVIICKRFHTFVYLLEKLQESSVLCLYEFLDFCFGSFETENGKDGKEKSGSQGKSVSQLWIKSSEVLLALIGKKEDINYSISIIDFKNPPIVEDNFKKFAKYLTFSVLEACLLLKKCSSDDKQKHTLMKDLWNCLSNLLKSSKVDVYEECFVLLNRKLPSILEKYKDDQFYPSLCKLVSELCDMCIDESLTDSLLETLFNIKLKIYLVENNIEEVCSLITSIKEIWRHDDQKNIILDLFKTEINDLTTLSSIWMFIYKNVISSTFDKKLFIEFNRFFILHFEDFGQDFIELFNNTFVGYLKSSENKEILELFKEEIKVISPTAVNAGNIIELFLTILANLNEDLYLSSVDDVLKLLLKVLCDDNVVKNIKDKFVDILLNIVQYLSKLKKNDLDQEIIFDVCQCIKTLPTEKKDPKLFKIINEFSESVCPEKNKDSVTLLKEVLTNLKDDSVEKVTPAKTINRFKSTTNAPSPKSSPLGISRTVKIGKNIAEGLDNSFEKVNALQLFGRDLDTITPIKIKGSQLKNSSPSSRSKKIINNIKKTPEPPMIDEEACDFVVINTEVKFDKDKLSEHQKEVLKKRREDIPALYQDLSQSQSQFSNDTKSNSAFALNPDLKIDDKTSAEESSKKEAYLIADTVATDSNSSENKDLNKNKTVLQTQKELSKLQIDIRNSGEFETKSRFRPRKEINSKKNSEETKPKNNVTNTTKMKKMIFTPVLELNKIDELVKNEDLNCINVEKLKLLENKSEKLKKDKIILNDTKEKALSNAEPSPKIEKNVLVDNKSEQPAIKYNEKTKQEKISQNVTNANNETDGSKITPIVKRKCRKSKKNENNVGEDIKTSGKKRGPKSKKQKTIEKDNNNSNDISNISESTTSDMSSNVLNISEEVFESEFNRIRSKISPPKNSTITDLNSTEKSEKSPPNEIKVIKRKRKRETPEKHQNEEQNETKPKKDKRRKKEEIKKITQLKLQDLKHFSNKDQEDIQMQSDSKKPNSKLIFIREISSANVKAKPGSLKRKKDTESSNIAYSIKTLSGFNSVVLNTLNPKMPLEKDKNKKLTKNEQKSSVPVKRGRAKSLINVKSLTRRSSPLAHGNDEPNAERKQSQTSYKTRSRSESPKTSTSPKTTNVEDSNLDVVIEQVVKQGLVKGTPPSVGEIKNTESQDEDVVESSQDCISQNISASIRTKIRSEQSDEKSNSKNIEINSSKPLLNDVKPMDETETCNSLHEPVEACLALDLPSETCLTDSEKLYTKEDTLTLKSQDFKENNEDDVLDKLSLKEIEKSQPEEILTVNENTEIKTFNSPTGDISCSPKNKQTPTLVQEFKDNTCDISPISSQNIDDKNEEIINEINDMLIKENDQISEPKTFSSNLRSTRLLNMINANSPLHKSTPTRSRLGKEKLPATERIKKLMLRLAPDDQKEKNDAATDKIQDDVQILTFSREVPSPFATPTGSILKRKLSETEEGVTPNAKRKRVSFNDPCISSKKIYLYNKEEYSAKNFFAEVPIDQLVADDVEDETEDVDPFTERDSVAVSSEETMDLGNPLSADAAIFKPLADCQDEINAKMIKKLSSAMYTGLLQKKLRNQKIFTIGDLAKMSECTINRLPFKRPASKNVFKVLNEYYINNIYRNGDELIKDDANSFSNNVGQEVGDNVLITPSLGEITNEIENSSEIVSINEKFVEESTCNADSNNLFKQFLEVLRKEDKCLEDCGSTFLEMVEEKEIINVLKNVYNTDFENYGFINASLGENPTDVIMKSVNLLKRKEKYDIVRKILDSLENSDTE